MGATTMQAIVYQRYGAPDVLSLEEIERPSIGDDDVRVRVYAASVNSWDRDKTSQSTEP